MAVVSTEQASDTRHGPVDDRQLRRLLQELLAFGYETNWFVAHDNIRQPCSSPDCTTTTCSGKAQARGSVPSRLCITVVECWEVRSAIFCGRLSLMAPSAAYPFDLIARPAPHTSNLFI